MVPGATRLKPAPPPNAMKCAGRLVTNSQLGSRFTGAAIEADSLPELGWLSGPEVVIAPYCHLNQLTGLVQH